MLWYNIQYEIPQSSLVYTISRSNRSDYFLYKPQEFESHSAAVNKVFYISICHYYRYNNTIHLISGYRDNSKFVNQTRSPPIFLFPGRTRRGIVDVEKKYTDYCPNNQYISVLWNHRHPRTSITLMLLKNTNKT